MAPIAKPGMSVPGRNRTTDSENKKEGSDKFDQEFFHWFDFSRAR
jgi:hypothetical protein